MLTFKVYTLVMLALVVYVGYRFSRDTTSTRGEQALMMTGLGLAQAAILDLAFVGYHVSDALGVVVLGVLIFFSGLSKSVERRHGHGIRSR